MKNERLIINLILQDLKHNQLLSGLKKIGLEASDSHYLDILEIVAELMGVPKNLADDWGTLYVGFMNQAIYSETTKARKSEALKSFAKVCYGQLKQLIENTC